MPMKVKSLFHFKKWLLRNQSKLNCVSFDIFDTVLKRCIEPPEIIHHRVSEIFSKEISGFSTQQLLSVRKNAEKKLRNKTRSRGLDFECKYDELMSEWVRDVTGIYNKQLTDKLINIELELELLALSPKEEIYQLLNWILKSPIKCIAVSDMYLSRAQIEIFLCRFNLDQYFSEIFVSSDFGLSKGSGRLHEYVLEKLSLEPNSVVHIGDNKVSDMWAPSRLGIRGVFLRERSERLRRIRKKEMFEKNPNDSLLSSYEFFESITDRAKSRNGYQDSNDKQFFFNYGFGKLGPAYSLFILKILEDSHKEKYDKLFFLARDGFIFFEMYKNWIERDNYRTYSSPFSYLYISRRTVACASLSKGLSFSQATLPLHNPKQKGIYSILKTYDLLNDFFIKKVKDHGFKSIDEKISDFNDPRLQSLIEDKDVQKRIKTSGKKSKKLLDEYLEQEGFFGLKKVCLIDIGWNGTIQKFLTDSYEGKEKCPAIYGRYFALVSKLHGEIPNAKGLVLDGSARHEIDKSPVEFEELFEQSSKSGEATTISYKKCNSVVIPVLKSDKDPDRKLELSANKYVKNIQEGIMLHLNHFHAVFRLSGKNGSQLLNFVLCILERIVIYPTNKEVKMLAKLIHTEDMGHDNILNMKGTYISIPQLIFFKRTLKNLRSSTSKYSVYGPIQSTLRGLLLRLLFLFSKRKIK